MAKNFQPAHDVDERFTLRFLTKGWEQKAHASWQIFFVELRKQKWFNRGLLAFSKLQEKQQLIPQLEQILQPFLLTSVNSLRVFIVGLAPYNSSKLATGLAFSSGVANTTPPSLKNILRELATTHPDVILQSNSLESWARQGVFLWNFYCMKSKTRVNNKQIKQWGLSFTKALVSFIEKRHQKIIYVLLGNQAKTCSQWINRNDLNNIITLSHPSPLSAHRGFFGSRLFEQIDKLTDSVVNWNLNLKLK